MIIGCFALIEPFSPMKRQFQAIREMGFDFADLTDNQASASLGNEYGFSASVCLESHPARVRAMFEESGLSITSVCAHANLLDPPAPDVYGTNDIIKAIRLAHHLGINQVITTEGDPKTDFGHRLTHAERIFSVKSKLQAPIAWAEELGIELLLEPHGILTDTVEGMGDLLEALGHEKTVGINLDTGNSWLGGGVPLDFVRVFGKRIKHVHWKDLGADWLPKRGKMYGCAMGTIPVGDGVIGIQPIAEALLASGFEGPTTLEVAGKDNLLESAKRLRAWEAKARKPSLAATAA